MARAMKDSGIEWIGEIPEGWEVVRVSSCFSEVKEKNTDCLYDNALQFKMGRIIPKPRKWDAEEIGETYSAYTIVHPRTIMVNGLNLEFDFVTQRVAVVEEDGIITSAYIAMSPNDSVDANYMCYLLKAYDYRRALHNMGKGLRKILNYSELKTKPILLPPLSEQRSIVRTLKTECSQIDAVIEQTRASIEEYKKLKQSVITEAVTKGIRPGRKIKKTGNFWISEIPVEWNLSRVGLHYDIILGKMLCTSQLSDEYTLEPYYCAANVHFEGISNEEIKRMWFSPSEKEQYLVQPGDLLIVEGGAGAGGGAVVKEMAQPIYIQNSIMIVRPKGTANNRYLRYLIEGLVNAGYVDVVCNKATIPHFTKDKLANVPLPVSCEQEIIADNLDEKVSELSSLIMRKERLITELESYKKSLIFEYVTGKKEVSA